MIIPTPKRVQLLVLLLTIHISSAQSEDTAFGGMPNEVRIDVRDASKTQKKIAVRGAMMATLAPTPLYRAKNPSSLTMLNAA
mmetsp:Transcript_3440/g.4915  ORF Transcript_3440/g.4915 Transcript_3440/m.4915 type:complete len:82 (-) Transcript_3440:462-707(-)